MAHGKFKHIVEIGPADHDPRRLMRTIDLDVMPGAPKRPESLAVWRAEIGWNLGQAAGDAGQNG